jgi:xylan 1,4-beta-xylosidase
MDLGIDHAGFKCDMNQLPIPLAHSWEHTVGSGHATLALRADWQKQLTRCSRELGFQHVRFHGILSDDMGTLVCEMEKFVYSFFNADQVMDFLLSIGVRPFVELSFMPTTLSSGNDIVFHYKGNVTPPKDYKNWEALIFKLVKHWTDRYGAAEVCQWYFEVWNEPNLDAFWKGSQEDYFRLYRHTAKAIKAVHNDIKVGGPATAKNEWISEFLNYCQEYDVPADFISTHHYPTDAFGKPGDDTISQLAQSRRSVLREEAAAVRSKAGDKPLYYTEWSTSSNPFDELHDTSYAAAFIVKTILEANGIVQGYSYWTFSDIFEENYFSSVPFHGGFGLLNIYGVPKPAFRAYEILHRLGDELMHTESKHETVDVWIAKKPGIVHIIITNWALPRHEIKSETVTAQLNNQKAIRSAYIERIDDDHANPLKTWRQAGSPDSLSPHAVHQLEISSQLVKEPLPVLLQDNAVFIQVVMPPQSVACITLETA